MTPHAALKPVVIDAKCVVFFSREKILDVNFFCCSVTIGTLEAYTIAATGELASIAPVVLMDDSSPPPRNQSALRFVHVSPGAPAVDIFVAGTQVPIFPNVAFGKTSGLYSIVKPGPYKLQVVPSSTFSVIYEFSVELKPKIAYSIYAEGLLTGKGDQAFTTALVQDL